MSVPTLCTCGSWGKRKSQGLGLWSGSLVLGSRGQEKGQRGEEEERRKRGGRETEARGRESVGDREGAGAWWLSWSPQSYGSWKNANVMVLVLLCLSPLKKALFFEGVLQKCETI